MASAAGFRAQAAIGSGRLTSAPLVARRPFTSCGACRAGRSAAPAAAAVAAVPAASGVRGGRQLDARCRSFPQHRVCFFGIGGGDDDYDEEDLTVAKLQVGVFGKVEEFKRELDKVASLMDTEDEGAAHELVQDLVILLSRNLEYCAYGASAIFLTPDFDEAEAKFGEVAMKERLVFKKETLSNVSGRLDRAALSETGKDVGLDKWLAITLLLAIERPLKLPKVRSLADLKQCFAMLGGLRADDVIAVELLWTPQEEGDSYSKEELLTDYPNLANL